MATRRKGTRGIPSTLGRTREATVVDEWLERCSDLR
jgi:hypothetical protein